jgi:carbon-monoxide dehydrogenase large subunit
VPLKNADGSPMRTPLRPALAADKVRYVGDPVACVVAETEEQARAAAEAVFVDIDPLPCVVDSRDAVKDGAPLVYDDVPKNVVLDYHYGDAEKVAQAFSQAAHVTRLHLINNRLVVNPMEPRACVGVYENGRFTLHLPVQSVMGMRAAAADVLAVPPESIRILAKNVGGSFGMKTAFFPEYICVAHAARALGRPVKWVDARSESFVSDHHGRDHEFTCELALDKDGHFLALRVTGTAGLGAYLTGFGPLIPALNVMKHIVGTYRTPLIEVRTKCALTHAVPVTAYRGAGRPEGNYYLERLVDTAAREMKIDPVELRKRNHIAPSQLPYNAPSGSVYDSGDFAALLDEALEKADYKGFAAREKVSAAQGKWRGIGIGQFLEVTAPGAAELGDIKFQPDGTVLLSTGTHDHGQGHWTSFAQVISGKLGIPFAKIRLMQIDSDALVAGAGTGGSKSIMASGNAFLEAADLVIEKARAAAADVLEASVNDIEFVDDALTVAGTDKSIGLLELAATGASLDVSHVHKLSPSTYPNGVHIAEVEVDPDTGEAKVVRYTSVNDFGTLVNPLIVAGQVQGGVVQGIGQCFLEHTIYTQDGQLASGSFTDYAMPRAEHAPQVHFYSKPSPARTNALGVKGCGEAGCAGALTSVMNALTDALARHNVGPVDMPATPLRLFDAIRAAGK